MVKNAGRKNQLKKPKIDKKYVFILIAVIIVSVTLILNTYMQNREAASGNLTSVIAVNQDIEANTTIIKEMLVYKSVSKEDMTENMYTSPDDILGMKALVPLYQGEILNKNRLSDFTSEVIDKDFAVKIDTTDKALNLLPGTFIDIWKVPTKEGFETGLEPELVFSKQYIIDVKNEAYVSYKDFSVKKADSSDSAGFTPDYIVLDLDESELKIINSLNSRFFTLRITLHKDNGYYNNLKYIQEDKSHNEQSTADETADQEEVSEASEKIKEPATEETENQNETQAAEEGGEN